MPTLKTNSFRGSRFKAIALAAIFVAGTAGCYEHVVGVEGGASGDYDIYEPNYDPDKDPLNFGASKKKKSQATNQTIPTQRYND